MTKILFLINTLAGGGAEKVLLDTVNCLDSSKYEITVQVIYNMGIYQSKLNSNIKYKFVYNKKCRILQFLSEKRITKLYNPRKFYNKYIKSDYDVEIAFLEGLPTKIIGASTNTKAKKIAWVHTDLMSYFDSVSVYKNISENKICYQRFDKIACVSDSVREKFIERFGNMGSKVQTVYNIVLDDVIRTKAVESIKEFKHDFPIVVSCGRLCEQKGFDRLLRIHKKLLDENIQHYLWIVGDGDLRLQFETYIKENNLMNTVKLLGFQANPYKYIKNADLFVCSSVAEGFSTVVTESAILGIPIISTDVAGAREPKDYPRCYKVVENNEDSLYLAMKQILANNEELEKAKLYTQSIMHNFNKESYLKNIMKFMGD